MFGGKAGVGFLSFFFGFSLFLFPLGGEFSRYGDLSDEAAWGRCIAIRSFGKRLLRSIADDVSKALEGLDGEFIDFGFIPSLGYFIFGKDVVEAWSGESALERGELVGLRLTILG